MKKDPKTRQERGEAQTYWREYKRKWRKKVKENPQLSRRLKEREKARRQSRREAIKNQSEQPSTPDKATYSKQSLYNLSSSLKKKAA